MKIAENAPPPAFMYLLSKARRYVKLGPQGYRADDALGMPPEDCPEPVLAAIRCGMEQLCALRGWSRDEPLEGIGIDGFYALLRTLHFEVEFQLASQLDDGTFLDEMHMRHSVTGRHIVLYNKVPETDEE